MGQEGNIAKKRIIKKGMPYAQIHWKNLAGKSIDQNYALDEKILKNRIDTIEKLNAFAVSEDQFYMKCIEKAESDTEREKIIKERNQSRLNTQEFIKEVTDKTDTYTKEMQDSNKNWIYGILAGGGIVLGLLKKREVQEFAGKAVANLISTKTK